MAATRHIKLPQLGQLCMIETSNEILVGNVKFIDESRKIIELENAYDQKTNYAYTSAQILGLPQIKTIKIIHNDVGGEEQTELQLKDTSCDTTSGNSSSNSSCNENKRTANFHRDKYRTAKGDVNNGDSTTTTTTENTTSADESGISCASVHLSSSELQLLQDQLNSVVYIDQADYHYHKAIADIKTQPVVGLLVEPHQFGRSRKTALITVATNRAVYIFDIIAMGKIFREFKVILEAERPRKAVHYSHKMVDHLQHRQGVQLAGIFDTFVAYCITMGKKAPLGLIETVLRTFNISEIYFDYETDDDNHAYDPYRRPISRHELQFIAKKAIFQLKLYEHLLHEQMLAIFYKQCSNFSQTFCENPDGVVVAFQMQPQSREGFQHIQPNGNWRNTLERQLKLLDFT